MVGHLPFRLFLFTFLISSTVSCKKGVDLPQTPVNTFSFKINNTGYSDANAKFMSGTGSTPIDFYYDRIEFNDPINPGNTIRFYASPNSCAFSAPISSNAFITDFSNCNLSFNSPPANPLKVFQYQSGTLTYSRVNCRNSYGYNIFTGQNSNLIHCDVVGTFELTLVNSSGQTIEIRDGIFAMYNIYFL